ncbi:[pyruvate dehydrogenase (acetyl-transferring)]-phosphatase [Trifolium repens]|nr:[pyruvate dehydrogenase (acetyl-transferring)]-phosphatase [Trifolium repens]
MAAVQANMDIEDHSQVEVGTDALFVGVYDGHKGDTAAIYLRDHIFGEILRRIQQNNNLMTELILKQVVHQMERVLPELLSNLKCRCPSLDMTDCIVELNMIKGCQS